MRARNLLCGVAAGSIALAADVKFAADKVHAEKNAYAIFNSVHSAGRQWGSSVYHNGFALIPAAVPRGSVFYHAAATKDQPAGSELLYFEPEAAEAFGSDRVACHSGCTPPADLSAAAKANPSPSDTRRYMHTYRNKRDLKLLLVDGMSAGNTNYGTLDTQNFVLLEGKELDKGQSEYLRYAQELCKVVQPWGYDGLIRAEMGFEIVSCNVTGTFTQMKVKGILSEPEKIGDSSMHVYQWARAASERYDGLGARLKLDFSSMVSGLFYPVNTTNPDPLHPEYKRLAATPLEDLRVIKNHVAEIGRARFQTFLIDWRYIVDTIVERFSDRLAAMADKNVGDLELVNEVETAAISYIDAEALESNTEGPANQADVINQSIKDCMDHYLYPALPFSGRWNQADHMLYHSVSTVMNDICTTFIKGWWDLDDDSDSHAGNIQLRAESKTQRVVLANIRSQVAQLYNRLGWTTWRKTRPCAVDETMFIAMWPYGAEEDYSNPGCRKRKELVKGRTGYWGFGNSDATVKASLSSLESEEL